MGGHPRESPKSCEVDNLNGKDNFHDLTGSGPLPAPSSVQPKRMSQIDRDIVNYAAANPTKKVVSIAKQFGQPEYCAGLAISAIDVALQEINVLRASVDRISRHLSYYHIILVFTDRGD